MIDTEKRSFGFRDKIGYMFGDFGNDFTFIFASTYLMVFYTKVFGIDAAMVGVLFLVSRCVDAFTDIGMGRIADSAKENSKGRFRVWIIRMCIPVALSSFLMYQSAIADASMLVKVIYMFVTYLLWGSIFYTSINIPYGSMASVISEKSKEALNQMWRNGCINDTYEPGSTFKIITASACLEERVVSLSDTFSCPGYRIVEDRKIRCHKVGGHGAETFVQGIQNSCNPVFIDIGLRLGTGRFCDYFEQFGLLGKTGVDLPGEAATIMHKEENIGQVELATMSFGQSFQVTPIQMAVTVSALVNGGKRVTPHFGVRILDKDKETVRELKYDDGKQIVSEETSRTMQALLESVVSEGSGKNAKIEGYHIGGKTATSQTLPRSANKYISSFIGFAPAANPQILGMCVIYNPQGVYYGGTIAAPVIRDIFDNIFPYLGIEKDVEMQYTN